MTDRLFPMPSVKARWFIVIAMAVCVSFYIGSTRSLFMDDAFIHLRIAHHLLDHRFYSFNGDSPTYSTSSPLYTALLGAFSTVAPGPYLPKVLGVVAYAVLFGLVAHLVIAATTPAALCSALAFLAGISSPMGVRWLTDGMETGLIGVVAILLGRVAWNLVSAAERRGFFSIGGCVLLGA